MPVSVGNRSNHTSFLCLSSLNLLETARFCVTIVISVAVGVVAVVGVTVTREIAAVVLVVFVVVSIASNNFSRGLHR